MLLLMFAACQEYALERDAKLAGDAPHIQVDPGELDFGALPLGEGESRPVTVTNIGDAPLDVRSLEVAGSGSFTLFGELGPYVLPPGASEVVEVVYTATSPDAAGTLYVHSDDPTDPDLPVPLVGTTVYGAIVEDPSPVDFGAVEVGGVVDTTLRLQNVGAAPATVTLTSLVGEPFALVDPPALPWVFEAGATLDLGLRFTPPDVGLHEGELWFEADDPVGTHLVRLIGTGATTKTEEPEEDPCFEPEDAWDSHPGGRLVLAEAGEVVFTYLGSYAGYEDELWLEEPEEIFLANNQRTSSGAERTGGPWGAGEELVLGLRVRTTGDRFVSGPGERNFDGQIHAAISYRGDCTWLVGFEDLAGGGDRDYNDMSLKVTGPLRIEE